MSAVCIHKQMCNSCGIQGLQYGTQALTVARWKLNNKGRLERKQIQQPLTKEDFVCRLITDVSIQSMVDNSVRVSTTAAEAAETRRLATSRLHANSNVKRLDIDKTVRVLQELGSDAAVIRDENNKASKALYTNMHWGAATANSLVASAAESSLDDATPLTSDGENDGSFSSGEEATAAAAGARGSRRSRTRRRSAGGGHKSSGSGVLKSTRQHHSVRNSKTDRYAAAVAKIQKSSPPVRGRAEKGKGKGKATKVQSRQVSTLDLDGSDSPPAGTSEARHSGWPSGTRLRFENLLPELTCSRFGGFPPVIIAHNIVAELYQCPFEDVDADVAGAVVKGLPSRRCAATC